MKRIMALAAMLPALAAAAAELPFKGDAAKAQGIVNQVCVACHAADGNSQVRSIRSWPARFRNTCTNS